ncbi:MAG: glycosyltransferase, partial [Phycisphaerales bacterium]
MNIALISREYPPFFGGGIGAYTHRFAHALAGAGHRPFVITVSEDGEQSIEEGGGVTVVRLPFIHANDWSAPHPRIATPETLAAFHAFHPVSVFAMQVARDMPALVRRHAIDIIEAPDTGALAWFLLNAARTGAPEAADLPPVVTVLHSPTDWIARWNRAPLRGRQDHELAGMERDQARWSGAVL